VPALLPVAAFGALVVAGARLRPDLFQDTFVRHLETFAFVGGDMHLLVPEWLAGGVADNALGQFHRFGQRLSSAEMHGLVVPTTLALLALAIDRFTLRRPRIVAAGLVLAALAPQVLHLAAWDTVRIWTFTIGAAALGAWAVSEHCPRREPGSATLAAPVVASFAIAANVLATTPLYDGLSEWHGLPARLMMYAPVLAGCVLLLVTGQRTE
jgi:hypothetical protein